MAGISDNISTINIDDCLDEVNKKYGTDIKYKKEQREIFHSLMCEKRDTFGFLPTGYGKSLAYILPPLLYDQVRTNTHTVQ